MVNLGPLLSLESLGLAGDTNDVSEKKSIGKREDELVFYAKINNFDGLAKAQSKEAHEQWQITSPRGKMRVRKTTKDGLAPQYSQAIKAKDNPLGGSEKEDDTTEEIFEAFKAIAVNGMIKDRYVFLAGKVSLKTEAGKQLIAEHGVKYEVDVFPKADGSGYHEICKIDVELNSLMEAIKKVNPDVKSAKFKFNISELPFQPSDLVTGNHGCTPEQKAMIDKWYQEIFLATPGNGDQTPVKPEPVENTEQPTEKTNEQPVQPQTPTKSQPVEKTDVDEEQSSGDEQKPTDSKTEDVPTPTDGAEQTDTQEKKENESDDAKQEPTE